MTKVFLVIIGLFLISCSQKSYFKNNTKISQQEYKYYENICNKNYQEYNERYQKGGVYSMFNKRYKAEFIRDCLQNTYKLTIK